MINRKAAYLKVYKTLGFLILSCVSILIFGYVGLMGFFLADYNWVAPTVMSPTGDKMLQYESDYQQVFQNLETLKVTQSQAERDYIATKENARLLHLLYDQMYEYMQKSTLLNARKKNDINDSYSLVNDLNKVKDQTIKSVQGGLITKTDATSALATIQQFRNATTDGNQSYHTLGITIDMQLVILRAQVIQADNDTMTKREMADAANKSAEVTSYVMKQLEQSSYYNAYVKHGSNLAFLPYDNMNFAKAGDNVYDCYLMVIICHKVGTISKVYHDEQLIEFPLFNVRFSHMVRGVMVELDMDQPKYMTSTLFFTGKPFGI